MTAPVGDDDLHAYVDGALPPDRAAQVESWLEAHPEQLHLVRQYREQVEGLHRLFDPVLDEPVPARLHAAARPRRRLAPVVLRMAASIVLLALGGMGGWWLRDHMPGPAALPPLLAREAMSAHVVFAAEIRHPVEVAAAEHAHLVGWLSKRLGTPLRTPDLSSAGLTLVGGRLLPAEEGPAAQFMYEDGSGQRLTVYVTRAAQAGSTAFRFASQAGASAFYWIDGDLAYAIVGGIGRDRLGAIAREVYHQLEAGT